MCARRHVCDHLTFRLHILFCIGWKAPDVLALWNGSYAPWHAVFCLLFKQVPNVFSSRQGEYPIANARQTGRCLRHQYSPILYRSMSLRSEPVRINLLTHVPPISISARKGWRRCEQYAQASMLRLYHYRQCNRRRDRTTVKHSEMTGSSSSLAPISLKPTNAT